MHVGPLPLQVFKQLTHCVTTDSLKLILEVLEPKQSKDDIMEVDGEEGSDSGDDGSDAGDSGDGSDAGDSGDDGEASDSGEDSSVGGDEVVDPLFRADIRKALGAAGMDSDVEVSPVIVFTFLRTYSTLVWLSKICCGQLCP